MSYFALIIMFYHVKIASYQPSILENRGLDCASNEPLSRHDRAMIARRSDHDRVAIGHHCV